MTLDIKNPKCTFYDKMCELNMTKNEGILGGIRETPLSHLQDI